MIIAVKQKGWCIVGKVKSLYKKTCVWCGGDFETNLFSKQYCDKEECQQARTDKSHFGNVPAFHEDMRLGVIAIIMADENINYTQYAKDREFYIDRYIKNHGSPY